MKAPRRTGSAQARRIERRTTERTGTATFEVRVITYVRAPRQGAARPER